MPLFDGGLILVFGLNVLAEIARLAVCFTAVRTLIILLLQVNSLNVTGEVSG